MRNIGKYLVIGATGFFLMPIIPVNVPVALINMMLRPAPALAYAGRARRQGNGGFVTRRALGRSVKRYSVDWLSEFRSTPLSGSMRSRNARAGFGSQHGVAPDAA